MRIPRRFEPRTAATEADTTIQVRKADIPTARDLLAEGVPPEVVARRTGVPLPVARVLAEQAQR